MKISARSMYQGQSHYIDFAHGAIFMRFGLILGQLAILKKKLGGQKKSNKIQKKFKKKICPQKHEKTGPKSC